ncbi:LOW QUALITY PROTEIN: limbin [Rhynchocyon petersi]
MLGGAGPGSGSARHSAAPALGGRAPAMGPVGAGWVLAGGFLATALAMPAGAGPPWRPLDALPLPGTPAPPGDPRPQPTAQVRAPRRHWPPATPGPEPGQLEEGEQRGRWSPEGSVAAGPEPCQRRVFPERPAPPAGPGRRTRPPWSRTRASAPRAEERAGCERAAAGRVLAAEPSGPSGVRTDSAEGPWGRPRSRIVDVVPFPLRRGCGPPSATHPVTAGLLVKTLLPTLQHGHISRAILGASEKGVMFQKCAVVSEQSDPYTAQVWLLVNTTRSPSATNLSDLVVMDNVTGLAIRGSTGNKTAEGFQAFRKKFMQAGDSFAVSYSASLVAGGFRPGEPLLLPAQLTFQSLSQNRTQLHALLTIIAEEEETVLPNHGIHAAGFFVAFVVSLVLTWLTLLFMLRYQCLKGNMFSDYQVQHHENKLEHSQFILADGANEDLALNDQMVDILSSEDPGSMLQALEDLEIATLNQADFDLEACRTQVSKDIIALLLKNLTSSGQLSPQVERRLGAIFKKQFLLLENEIQDEYDRKMVALTAECDLETRKKTESQYQREMVALEELEELLKRVSERSAAACSSLLRTVHGLEQEQLRRMLALQQEEDFAKAHRQLAVLQRNELHRIFFTQIRSALCRGDLKPEVAQTLLRDYSEIQDSVDELMDFFQATKRYHLGRRFRHREHLVQSVQGAEGRAQGLLSVAAAQLTRLVQKHERAGYLDEDQMEMLLERAQTEVFSVKQKLDNDLKQERKRLRQKLISKRRRAVQEKHKEHRREQLSLGEAFRAAEDAGQYLGQWRSVMAERSAALEELQDRLDQAALDDLRALTLSLTEKATEELRRLQSSGMTQELLKRSAPWLFLQQILEEHGRELAARAEQLEAEERSRGPGGQGARQRLQEDALGASAQEQAELRRWERTVFTQLCSAPRSLSEEELLRMKQEAQGCFAEMDQSLALPKIRARVLLQQCQAAWREAEFQKLDQALAAPELQPSRGKKQRAKADLLRKCLEDKVQLLEDQAPEELVEKVQGELLRERVQQLEALEQRFAESVVSLQFQKAAKRTKMLCAYTALLSIQDLLLEELSETETLTKAACAQILASHTPELQDLERKLEEQLGHQDAAGQQQALAGWQQWGAEGPGPLTEPGDVGPEGQVSAILRRALGKGQEILEQHQQRLREEKQNRAVLEDLLENMENGTFLTLHGQELRLAAYLTKLAAVPGSVLLRLLGVVQPTAPQPELLAALDTVGEKHADHAAPEWGDGGEQADLARRRRHQDWWKALEGKLRGDLASRGLEKVVWAHRRKESILQKTCLPLTECVAYPGKGSWPHLSLEPLGELAPVSIVGAEAVDLLDTGEKLFIFRNPMEPEISLHVPPRRKKRNFLNAKKATWASGLD